MSLADKLEKKFMQMNMIEPGEYDCTIVHMDPPVRATVAEGIYRLGVAVKIANHDQRAHVFLHGYQSAVDFLYRARDKFIGEPRRILIRHRTHDSAVHLDITFLGD